MKSTIRYLIIAIGLALGLTAYAETSVVTDQKSNTTPTMKSSIQSSVTVTATDIESSSLPVVMGVSKFQTTLPSGEPGEIVIWNQGKLKTEDALIAYINKNLGISVRMTSETERAFFKTAFSQEFIDKTIGELAAGDLQKIQSYQRNYAYIVRLGAEKKVVSGAGMAGGK